MPGMDEPEINAREPQRSDLRSLTDDVPLVIDSFPDSDSALAAEAEVIDRWFGGEIAALFGD